MPNEKNPVLAAILGFVFGGFGLFYISVGQGIAALAVLFIGGIFTAGAAMPIIWIGCAVWGYNAAIKYNEQQQLYYQQESELGHQFGHTLPPTSTGHFAVPNQTGPFSAAGASPQEVAASPQFCGQCGSTLRPNIKFCTSCGSSI